MKTHRGWLLCLVVLLLAGALFAQDEDASRDRVPPPWTPVKVDGNDVHVWNRVYRFGRGPLPVQIKSVGRDLLAAPISLELDGRSAAIEWEEPARKERSATKAILASEGRSPGIRWTAETEVAYDGLVWIALKATPEEPDVRINRLSLSIPVAESEARLYSHQLVRTARMAAGWRRHFVDAPEKLWNAGAMPKIGWAGEFTPQVWLGSYYRGLAFIAESPQKWAVEPTGDILFIKPPSEGRAVLRVDFVQKPFSPPKGWTVEFGIMATPVRPPVDRPEFYRLVHTGGAPLSKHIRDYTPEKMEDSKLDVLAKDGVKIVLLWNSWSNLWGFPLVTDPAYKAFLHKFIDHAHSLGMKVIPYCGALLLMPDNHPEFKERSKQFLLSREYRKNPFHEGVGNYRVTPSKEFTDWFIPQLAALVREYKFDGIYLDTIAKVDQPLQDDRVHYAWREWRRLYERIYRVFHGDVIDNGYVFFHDSEPNIFMLNAFADMRLSGEMQYFCAVARKEVIPVRPNLKDRMPLKKFFAWTSGYALGDMPTYWCPKPASTKSYSVGSGMAKSSYTVGEILSADEMFALCGLFRMHPASPPTFRVRRAYHDQIVPFWKLESDIARQAPVWIPFWEAEKYVALEPHRDVAAAAFLAAGRRMLLHVANLEAEKKQIDVRLLPPTGLDGKPLSIAACLAGAGSSAAVVEGRLRLTLAPNSYVRVMVLQ